VIVHGDSRIESAGYPIKRKRSLITVENGA